MRKSTRRRKRRRGIVNAIEQENNNVEWRGKLRIGLLA